MSEMQLSVEARASMTAGVSGHAIYRMVRRALLATGARGGILLDVGCGTGGLRPFVEGLHDRYIGVDAVRYDSFPADAEFVQADLNHGEIQLPDGSADFVVSVETIEHLENPRGHVRELARLAKPGGWVVVTTPNQLSLLSLLSLVVKQRFVAFQDVDYPKHLTALLEVDLRRIAGECGLVDASVHYSLEGRIAATPNHYPAWVSRRFPRACSDNVLLIAKKAS